MLSVTPASLSGADLEKNILADYDKWQPIVERQRFRAVKARPIQMRRV